MGVWTHIILEGYCMFSSCSKRNWTTYECLGKGKISKKAKIVKNNGYIPKSNRPVWCKNTNRRFVPQFQCLCYGKNWKRCPFFACTNADRKDYLLFNKAFSKKEYGKEFEKLMKEGYKKTAKESLKICKEMDAVE